MADEVPTSSSSGRAPLTATVDQGEDLGKGVGDSFEADIRSTEGGHSVSNDPFFDVVPSSMSEEQMVFTGSATDDDDMLEADDSNIGDADLSRDDLAIVPHVDHSFEHGRDGDDTANSDAVPLFILVPQTVLTSRVTGMLYSVLIPLSCVDKE